ncbi:MAG: hypothetical protein ACKOKB_00965, partial [Bacteroidota bacterium]
MSRTSIVAAWLRTIGYQQGEDLLFKVHRIRITWDAAACTVSSAITRAIIDNNWLRDFMLATRPNKPITNN